MIKLLLPMIILLIVIAFPFIFVKMKGGHIKVKVTYGLLYIYVSVLLLSICLVPYLSDRMVEARERVSKEQINVGVDDFHTALSEGDLEKLTSQNFLEHSSFVYQQPTMKIKIYYEDDTQYSQVYVERKPVDDGMIDAYVFAPNLFIGGYDFTDKLKPLLFSVSDADSTLMVSRIIEREEIKIALTKNEFTINQFSDQTRVFDIELHNEPAVYIQIPKGIEVIENKDLDLIYVGENS